MIDENLKLITKRFNSRGGNHSTDDNTASQLTIHGVRR